MKIETNIDIPKNLRKINDDAFWKDAGVTWWKLMLPFIPMQFGVLASTANIVVKKEMSVSQMLPHVKKNTNAIKYGVIIEFKAPYASKMYNGNFNFRTNKHSMATGKWDMAAIRAKKDQQLIGDMQRYVDSGRLNLDK